MRTMHHTTWIVIADDKKARLLEYRGPNQPLQPIAHGELEGDTPVAQEIDVDQPGRTKARAAEQALPMEPPVDSYQDAKLRFLDRVAERLNQAADRNEIDRLVLVAPPKALGELRHAFDSETRKLVIGELDKDLTNLALHDLPSHLGSVINI